MERGEGIRGEKKGTRLLISADFLWITWEKVVDIRRAG
jgi:hypothetical protein